MALSNRILNSAAFQVNCHDSAPPNQGSGLVGRWHLRLFWLIDDGLAFLGPGKAFQPQSKTDSFVSTLDCLFFEASSNRTQQDTTFGLVPCGCVVTEIFFLQQLEGRHGFFSTLRSASLGRKLQEGNHMWAPGMTQALVLDSSKTCGGCGLLVVQRSLLKRAAMQKHLERQSSATCPP